MQLDTLSIYQYFILGVYNSMVSGIAFEKCTLGHIIISHNVSWSRIKKWVMHVQFEQSRDRVDAILKMRRCFVLQELLIFSRWRRGARGYN